MRFEFNQGVPEGCVDWLWENVGQGNLSLLGERFSFSDSPEYDWFYERIEVEIRPIDPKNDSNLKYVPTITVKDDKMAVLFSLRWA